MHLTDVITDDFGRQFASVWIGKNLIQYDMLRNGMVQYESVQSSWKEAGVAAEGLAKQEKRGIYAEQCLSVTPPDSACTVKGNRRQGRALYHIPGCPNYGDVVIDRSFGDEWFCTEVEAEEAGFEKAKGCK